MDFDVLYLYVNASDFYMAFFTGNDGTSMLHDVCCRLVLDINRQTQPQNLVVRYRFKFSLIFIENCVGPFYIVPALITESVESSDRSSTKEVIRILESCISLNDIFDREGSGAESQSV